MKSPICFRPPAPSPSLSSPSLASFEASSQTDYRAFTPEMGNMAVANAYSLAQAESDGSILLELGLKEVRAL